MSEGRPAAARWITQLVGWLIATLLLAGPAAATPALAGLSVPGDALAGVCDFAYDSLGTSTTSAVNAQADAPRGEMVSAGWSRSSTSGIAPRRAAKKGPDEFGPFHRREGPQTADEMAKVRSGQLDEVQGGTNQYGHLPSVDAFRGPLPLGQRGYEFFTPVAPRLGTPPHKAQWPQGHPGVRDIGNDRVAIPCRVTKCR